MPETQVGFLRHIHKLNAWNPEHFTPFFISGKRVGYLKEPMCKALGQWPRHFSLCDERVELAEHLSFKQRNAFLDEVSRELVANGSVPNYLDETYPVIANSRDKLEALLDRGSAGCFGIQTFGQHLNGYVRTRKGIKLWIARRAPDRFLFPNHLDNMVAGGLPQNLSLQSNLRKECREEANLPDNLFLRAIPTGTVSYCCETEKGLKPDTLFCYDLELPTGFTPENTDGEVAEFMLLDLEEVMQIVHDTDEFKPNCNLVILDFLLRHGAINPEDPDYLQLVSGLHPAVSN